MTSSGTAVTASAEPGDGGSDLATPEGAVGDSLSVAAWTIISRCTGVLRGVAIAAVLGATFFANTYQFTNSLPNLVFYGLLAGSMFSSLLVVRMFDSFFAVVGLTGMSLSREFSATICPSYTGSVGETNITPRS